MTNYNKNRIVTNELMNPTKRIIKSWKDKFVVTDGPHTSEIFDLSDIAIPNESHYSSRVVLPANAIDFVLKYNNLDNITFLLIKVKYNGNYDNDVNLGDDSYDSYYKYEENDYNIEYYYQDNPSKIYPINKLLILNGSLSNKINQICLNNPLDYDVVLEILAANILVPQPQLINSATTINNLFYSNIITDQIVCISGVTGSTEFIISEYKSDISGLTEYKYNIPYIDIINIENKKDEIKIITKNNYFILKFLTEYDHNQTYCRIMFILSDYYSACLYLTGDFIYLNNYIVDCSISTTTTTII